MVDYQEAVQSPPSAFSASELRSGKPVMNKLGMPRPICGTFASVYELASGGRRWAVKCFLRNIPDLHQRYAKISDHLKRSRWTRYFATFEYQDKGILVQGKPFPLVKMEWVEGYQLNTFIEQNLSRRRVLAKLKKTWVKLLADLRTAHIAHGDLQHGNVLVGRNGDLRLIDYDGMWVPALAGEESNETGHPDYQNPTRTQKDFHEGVDEFSDAVIQIAICALARDTSLWGKYNNGDNLLFRRRNFLDPQSSPLIRDLQALADPEINEKLEFVLKACPRRRKAKGKKKGAPRAAWLSDYVEEYPGKLKTVTPQSSSQPRSAPKPAESPAASTKSTGFFSGLIRSLFGS